MGVSVCLDISSVPSAPRSVNDRERSKPIIKERIRSLSQLCKRIYCNAELVAGCVNWVILTAQNAAKTASDMPIESDSDGITEKP